MAKKATKKSPPKPALKLTPRLKQSVKPPPKPPPAPKAAKAKAAAPADEKAPSLEFEKVLAAVGDAPGVTRPKMFGHNGLAVGGKFFAIDWRGHLVVKLARAEVDALVGKGVGVQFDPGMGRPMKEWIQVAPGATSWAKLAARALGFVGGQLAG